MKKERIDVLCVEKGLFDSREKAKMTGNIKVIRLNGNIIKLTIGT